MEKGKNYDAGVNAEYNSFKGKLMESLNNNNQKINVYQIFCCVIDYSVKKDYREIQRLQQIIQIMLKG